MTLEALLRLARLHVADNAKTEGSARLCLADAVALADDGDRAWSARRALQSLAYSVGTGHPAYLKARAHELTAGV